MNNEQHVCTVCGYNMIGECPDRCPFCGADRRHFLTMAEASARYRVVEYPVSGHISRVNTEPGIGIEHASYRVDTGEKVFLIDCPVVYDVHMGPVDVIAFTHPHFLGASNLYRELFGAEVWIHAADAADPLARPYAFDRTFERAFSESGLEAHPIDGHTPGFTVYMHEDALFPCDLVFREQDGMRFNPYGPEQPTRHAGARLWRLIEKRGFTRVCGWNYVADHAEWREQFRALLETAGTI
jgi:hydroxyacylglutathione hydrolase